MLQGFTIRLRLTIWYLLSVTLIVAVMGVASWWTMRASLYGVIDDNLNRRITNMHNSLQGANIEELRQALAQTAKGTAGGGYYQVFTETGVLIYQSEGLLTRGVTTLSPNVKPGTMSFRDAGASASPVRLGARLVAAKGGNWIVEWGEPLNLTEQSLRTFVRRLLLWAPLLIALGMAISYGISSRALAPVDGIIRDARSINTGNLSERLSVPKAHDELRRLTETLNSMLDRIDASMRHIRQFTADASHELRSPITLMRTAAEFSLRRDRTKDELLEAMVRIKRESEHTTQLINDLLLLTRADAQVEPHDGLQVDFSAAARDVLQRIAPLVHSKPVRLQSDLPAISVWVAGGYELMERLVVILVDNAVKYTPEGGEVQVKLSESEGSAVLEVSDNGIGIAEADLPRIFDRFWRADKVRSRQMGGTGLGLSIARVIVEQCGGSIRAESELGLGSRFVVKLPIMDAAVAAGSR